MVSHPSTHEHWAQIKEICCATAASGDPIARERWPFFGENWVGPYERLRSQWSYIFLTEGRVLGYLTGCPDTQAFEKQKRLCFTPRLIAEILLGQYPWNADVKRFLKRAFHLEKNPNDLFPLEILRRIERDFPAHLHINFREEARGSGAGRALMEAFIADLRALRIKGVHVFCGPKPVGFYERVGFEVLDKIEFKKDVWIFAMGRKV